MGGRGPPGSDPAMAGPGGMEAPGNRSNRRQQKKNAKKGRGGGGGFGR